MDFSLVTSALTGLYQFDQSGKQIFSVKVNLLILNKAKKHHLGSRKFPNQNLRQISHTKLSQKEDGLFGVLSRYSSI